MASNVQCKGKAAAVLREFQGSPPIGRGHRQIPGGPEEEEEMSSGSAAGSQLPF